MTPPELYCSAFSGTLNRYEGPCVRFDYVSRYFWFVAVVLRAFMKFVLETGRGASCLLTDICGNAVEKLRNPNLKAPFSDLANIVKHQVSTPLNAGFVSTSITINRFQAIESICRRVLLQRTLLCLKITIFV